MDMKQKIIEAIDKANEEILSVSHTIHDNPELGNEEWQASALLCATLENRGYEVERGTAGLPTAFMATKKGKEEGPAILILAEYDALKDIGHACGHNIIAASAVGAAIGLSEVLDNLAGKITVAGTPAEETTGGKIAMADAGVFNGYDFALEIHPTAGPSMIRRGGRACTTVFADFTGVSAHSSAPSTGVNAVSAVVSTFQNVDALRPLFDPMDNVNGVIPYGGGANNVISGEARAEFCLRSSTLYNLNKLIERVEHAAKCAALLFGAKVETRVDPKFAERYPNLPIGLQFKQNLESLGEPVTVAEPEGAYGSSDFGNVSILMPAIHEYISIAPDGVNGHSAEMREAASSPAGDRACILGSKAIAMTAFDLLTNKELRENAQKAWLEQVPAVYRS